MAQGSHKQFKGMGVRWGGNFEVGQFHVGNFACQIGREISHAKCRGLCEISPTLAADTVDSAREGLFAVCALHVHKPSHFMQPLSHGTVFGP